MTPTPSAVPLGTDFRDSTWQCSRAEGRAHEGTQSDSCHSVPVLKA